MDALYSIVAIVFIGFCVYSFIWNFFDTLETKKRRKKFREDFKHLNLAEPKSRIKSLEDSVENIVDAVTEKSKEESVTGAVASAVWYIGFLIVASAVWFLLSNYLGI